MKLSPRLRQLATQIDALSLRERALVMLGAVMVLFLAWDWLLMSGTGARSRAVSAEIEVIRQRTVQLNHSVTAAVQQRGSDPNAALEQTLSELGARIESVNRALGTNAGRVIPPQEMAGVLEEVLRRQGSLELVSVRSLPRVALFEQNPEEDAATDLPGAVYRHGLEMEVEGRYLDVLAYLKALESLPWQFFWDTVALESTKYPSNRVRIRVYSLNLEEGWLGV